MDGNYSIGCLNDLTLMVSRFKNNESILFLSVRDK